MLYNFRYTAIYLYINRYTLSIDTKYVKREHFLKICGLDMFLFNYYNFFMTILSRKLFIGLLVVISSFFLFASLNSADATHSWGYYHWARTANPFTLKLGDNLSTNWKPYLSTTSSDWSQSNVLDTSISPGLTNPR